jgi:colanic acid/amylovoran biosynthesis protein
MPKVAVKPDQIFVSVINCAGRDESHNLNEHDGRYVANMAGLLQQLLTEGKKIVLASFCKEEGDEEGIRKILAAMGCEADPRVRVLCYDGTNADELTSAIAQSGGVIGTRFHATILAMTAGRPVLPIVYSDKTKYVLEDLGFTGTVYDLREDRPWMTTAMATMTVPACEAERHFAKLDMWLGR